MCSLLVVEKPRSTLFRTEGWERSVPLWPSGETRCTYEAFTISYIEKIMTEYYGGTY